MARKSYTFKTGVMDHKGVAWGRVNDTLLETGWVKLDVRTNKENDDRTQMYAAGFVEGVLTAERIWQMYNNTYSYVFTDEASTTPYRQWFAQQRAWVDSQVAANPNSGRWRHIGYVNAQLDGLAAGYTAVHKEGQALDAFAFTVLNGFGDLLDLTHVIEPEKYNLDYNRMNKSEARAYVSRSGHCSALVKVSPDYSELYFSHSSWFIFQATMRIYKTYNFELSDETTASRHMSFSSYPGYLESLDDFYLMPDTGLVMLQTTNNVFNASLYKQVVPESILAWQRVRAANHMSRTGSDWGSIMDFHNSGTYNNQYMIVNTNLFTPKQSLADGTLYVIEQIPTLVEYSDQTPILRTGYWPSYNVPFFERVYNLSGYPEFVAKHGVDFSHELAPRAKIFRRDANNVHNFDEFKALMRQNKWKTDPLAEGSPENAICSRGDLVSSRPDAGGCYDTKASSYDMFHRAVPLAHTINGPTHQDGNPPFSWTQFPNDHHLGLPDVYNFDFVEMESRFDF
jgi:hypothetical protein